MKILIFLFIFIHIIYGFSFVNNEDNQVESNELRFSKQKSNKVYQTCVTPNGSKGHCKHIQNCVLPDFKRNFFQFLDNLCIIEQTSVGVCCPDDISDRLGISFNSKMLSRSADSPMLDEDVGEQQEDALTKIVNEPIVTRPEDRGCGVSTKQFSKISGGRPSNPDEWPWMAALMTLRAYKSFCGGVLITDRHILTAAHCTNKYKASEILVRLGEYDFRQQNDTRSRDFRVTEIRQHIDFDMTTYEADIAIVKLFRPSLFNTYIWPICMPPIDESWAGWSGVVIGWGTQSFGGPHSDVLMEVTLPIWSNIQCTNVFVERIDNSVLCAGATEGGRDSCQGDSGGPLLVQLSNRRWVTVGIVSWGIRCGEPNHPGIYTRVSYYLEWIIENSVF